MVIVREDRFIQLITNTQLIFLKQKYSIKTLTFTLLWLKALNYQEYPFSYFSNHFLYGLRQGEDYLFDSNHIYQ